MKEDIKIAWRNLWRNRRRTVITSASVFFAVFFSVIMRSYQLGSYDHMIVNFIESFTGYLQVQHEKYQDNPLIDYSIEYDESVAEAILNLDMVVSVTPHIESFILASSGQQTKGVAVIAIDPERERSFSDPEKKLVSYRISDQAVRCIQESESLSESLLKRIEQIRGRAYASAARIQLELRLSRRESDKYLPFILQCAKVSNAFLTSGDEGILVADRLADFLKVTIGDSVILIGQGYQGVTAAGIFPVRGILKMPSPELDNKLIIMALPAAQMLFNAEGKITSLVVNLENKSKQTFKHAKSDIERLLTHDESVVKTWYELNPILHQQIEGDNQSGMAMLGILYFIIFFGIFGTVLMMVSERKREFGVLVSIGMQKGKLMRIITFEMLMLGTIGLIAGLLASAPFIIYFHLNPIVLTGDLGNMMADWGWDPLMPAAWFGPYFYWQAAIVALMVLMATLYPLRKISRLKEIEALRS